MAKDYSQKKLRNASFKDEDLSYARFSDSDLRGADFTGANLTGAIFTHVRTGITPLNTVLLFVLALAISLLSGYVAMLAGQTVQTMFKSSDSNVRLAGIVTCAITVLFIAYAWWRGGSAIMHLIIPAVLLAIVVGVVAYFSGLGTGMGMLYLVLALLLVTVMFIVGIIARTAAGAVSNILFIIVALSGGIFGRSAGGGIGTVIMAISCALISKRALSGTKGFEGLKKIADFITRKFGTSFRNSKLTEANFSQSKIYNADFTNADLSFVNWANSKKFNCITDVTKMTVVKK
ncbi:MAG: pentapeptide repeat-containing protein [Bacteroidetes bacterium]|nr:MAG: pentapeptide repeat-containing protein [Bacteroidota bacterium]